MKNYSKEQTRFDARLSKEQKQFFEKAAYLGGYRSLTDFVMLTVQERAVKIVKEKEQIIASKRDGQIFFDAITNPKRPSNALKKGFKNYKAFVAESKK